MRSTTPHLCAEPGCPTIVDGAGRCAAHGSSPWDRWRCTAEGRRRATGYGWRWTRARNDYIGRHPRCERCGADAAEVHHRDGRMPSEPGANVDSNLESLCRRCHRRARVGVAAARNGGGVAPRRELVSAGRPAANPTEIGHEPSLPALTPPPTRARA